MSDTERQIQMLYEIPSLTDELRDEAAKALLQWGEGQMRGLLGRGGDVDQTGAAFRRLVKRINRLVGRRFRLPPEKQQAMMDLVIESARGLGYHIDNKAVDTYLKQPASNQMADLQRLLNLLHTSGG